MISMFFDVKQWSGWPRRRGQRHLNVSRRSSAYGRNCRTNILWWWSISREISGSVLGHLLRVLTRTNMCDWSTLCLCFCISRLTTVSTWTTSGKNYGHVPWWKKNCRCIWKVRLQWNVCCLLKFFCWFRTQCSE